MEAGEAPFEREIARALIAQQQACHHPQRQEAAKAQSKGAPVGRGALLEDEKVAKPPESHQNSGRGGHHGQLHEQGREQKLVRQEERRPWH
jgi:hypothetical protein